MKSFIRFIEEASSSKIEKDFDRLINLIHKNKHKWNGHKTPDRLYKWVDDLNMLISDHKEEWNVYCKKHDLDQSSNAHDILA